MIRKPSLVFGALLGGITSLPLMALLYLGGQFTGLPFVPFDLFDWLARVLPGDIVTLGIDSIVAVVRSLNVGPTSEVAKLMEQLLALGLGLGGGILLGLVIALALRRTTWPALYVGAVAGLVLFLLVVIVEIDLGLSGNPVAGLVWLALLVGGWPVLLARLLAAAAVPAAGDRAGRRAALTKIIGGSAAVALGAWGVGALFENQKTSSGAGQPLANLDVSAGPPPTPTAAAPSAAAATPSSAAAPATRPAGVSPTATTAPMPTATATLREQVPPAPGTRPELTANEDFYRIDINTRPPTIDGESWVLEIAGLFDNARSLTLKDLLAYPAVTQPITLSCISNPIAGDLISTSNWVGVRLRDVLKDLGLRPEAKELHVEAADGFYEGVVLEDMMDPRTLLVYGMNEETLPVEHGFPLRIYIPNRYGMKQPKWITRITAIDEEAPGYWPERGWSETAHPNIVSVIDTIAREEPANGRIPVGGIAWAGDRGIQKVEVQVDGGEWLEAGLRTPPLSPLTWVQWRYDWPAEPGEHTFRVRATDGTGRLQTEEETGVRPDGATGYHQVTETI